MEGAWLWMRKCPTSWPAGRHVAAMLAGLQWPIATEEHLRRVGVEEDLVRAADAPDLRHRLHHACAQACAPESVDDAQLYS